MPNNNANEGVQNWGEEDRTGPEIKSEPDKVSDWHIFVLGKYILLVCAILFALVAALRAFGGDDSKGIADVWDFSKTILNSITSLVLGSILAKEAKAIKNNN